MTFRPHHVEWLVLLFFACVVCVVYYQIATAMTEDGIASGDPFHNAAFHPKIVAGVIICGVVLQAIALLKAPSAAGGVTLVQSARPTLLLLTFGLFLATISFLGYHLTAAPFLAVVMVICGERRILPILLFSTTVATATAFMFEHYLKIVLPTGIFSINPGW